MRADSGSTPTPVAVCREMDVRFSITISPSPSGARPPAELLIEGYPRTGRRFLLDGAAAVAETTYTPFQSEPDAAPVRLIVRRVKPMPSSQLETGPESPDLEVELRQ